MNQHRRLLNANYFFINVMALLWRGFLFKAK
jgi:hypothetical protein